MSESESTLIKRIAARYPSPAYALFDHVRNQTGYSRRVRTADALVLSLWPTNGLALHGFEVKCSKSDLMNEFKDPSKSGEFIKYCHYWWVVVSDLSFIDGLQVPETWGVLAPFKNSLKAMKPAAKLDPIPMDISFICGLARSIHESTEAKLKTMIKRTDIEPEVKSMVDSQVKRLTAAKDARIESLTTCIKEFELASGLSITDSWNNGRIGGAVRILLGNGGVNWLRKKIESEISETKRYLSDLELSLKSVSEK